MTRQKILMAACSTVFCVVGVGRSIGHGAKAVGHGTKSAVHRIIYGKAHK